MSNNRLDSSAKALKQTVIWTIKFRYYLGEDPGG